MTETNPYIKALFEENLEIEISHLHKAVELLKKYENKDWCEVIPDGEFPSPLKLHENIDYVREILGTTVQFTGYLEEYKNIDELSKDANFFKFQEIINPKTDIVPSHNVIDLHISNYGIDYRYETAPNPVKELRPRNIDNVKVGRVANSALSTDFTCNDCD